MHDSIVPFAALLGVWRGEDDGEFPTIEAFSYVDEWEFTENGKPFIHFVERTWSPAGQPMHTETGYLHAVGPGQVELVAAIPTGQAEYGSGTVTTDHGLVIVTDTDVQNTATAKHVDQIIRRFSLRDDELIYEMSMAAVNVEMSAHLRSTLRRVG